MEKTQTIIHNRFGDIQEVSIEVIYRKMNDYWQRHSGDKFDRVMIITLIPNNHRIIGTVFFSLNGSPPKGYTIYNNCSFPPFLRFLNQYGKCWKIWKLLRSIPRIHHLIDEYNKNLETHPTPTTYLYGNAEENGKYYPGMVYLEYDKDELWNYRSNR